MAKFNGHKYTWQKPFGSVRHQWELRTVDGGISFHASIMDNDRNPPACGLEFHSIYPRNDEAPHHIDCPVTGGRCWHDGTSLYASETLWPMIADYLKRGDHDKIFSILEHESDRLKEYRPSYLFGSGACPNVRELT